MSDTYCHYCGEEDCPDPQDCPRRKMHIMEDMEAQRIRNEEAQKIIANQKARLQKQRYEEHRRALFIASRKLNIETLLEEISVMPPGQWENALSPRMPEWYAVTTDVGIIAYFNNKKDAFRFRLDYINQILNG